MRTAFRRGLLLGLMLLSLACGGSLPSAPTASAQLPAAASPPAPPATSFPPLSGPVRTFTFDHELTYNVRDYTKHSRFLLYDNGAFALQYTSLSGEYRGGYKESNGTLTFEWEGSSTAGPGPWSATATLNDGSLTVRYNLLMQLSDFEDAVYRLAP